MSQLAAEGLPPVLKQMFEAGARALKLAPGKNVIELVFQDDRRLASYRVIDGPNGADRLADVDEDALRELSDIVIERAARR
jgi:hypothetical protein